MYKRACKNCGVEFETRTYRKEKCRPDCGRKRGAHPGDEARQTARADHEVEFIAVDGEGVNTTEWVEFFNEDTQEVEWRLEPRHSYVLLSVGDQSLHKDGAELSHDEIFTFLWEHYEQHPNASFVGFFLGYDFTEWLKSLHADYAWQLLTKEGIARRTPADADRPFPFPVVDGPWETRNGFKGKSGKWEFDLLANKRFKLRPYIRPELVPLRLVLHQDGTSEYKKIVRPWMYVCDSGPFFQTSFLNAIYPGEWATPILSQAEYDRIEIGKTHRQDAEFNADMIEYNVLENDVMSRLMTLLNEGFVADGIRLRKDQWFGPGQAAQAWMRNIGVPTGEEIREVVPKYARDAARKSYFGGWFEIFGHGVFPGTSYAYDINSAYPYVIAKLPCLLHGQWSHGTGRVPKLQKRALRLVYATLRGTDEWVGPMPHRDPSGSILRPEETKGWYWQHELDASKRAGLLSRTKVHEWIDYQPCACDPPMESIRELYMGRLTIGKNTSSGKAKKLVYNSSYGKLAQSVGQPRFSNPIWASLITAGCRAQILGAIATHPSKSETLLMVATDGIVFKEPHPSLDVHSTRLGAWDAEEYENLSLFMPGLYWHDKARADIREGKIPKLKSRGVNPRDMSKIIDHVDHRWSKLYSDPDFPAEKTGPPIVKLRIDWALITAKQAIVRDRWDTCGQIIYDAERELNGKPDAKRELIAWHDRTGGWRSRPYVGCEPPETAYYERGFGEPMEDHDEEGQMVTPDGSVADVQAWAFGQR